ncbi:MAG: DUF3106 domain-containing protein [Gemmatimonadaceae bacterium]|nr:DUF3106 domain-containing protein [Gemmatimonadaceae bacterium]
MKTRLMYVLALGLALSPLSARAQVSTTNPAAGRRELALERREAMRARRDARAAMTPEQRKAARADRKARFDAMPPDQQQYVRDLRRYQQGLKATSRQLQGQVSAGSITRDAMAQQLKAYRDANRPSRPATMPGRTRTP